MKPEKSKKEVQLIHEDGSSVARSNGNSSIDSSSENFSGKTIRERVFEIMMKEDGVGEGNDRGIAMWNIPKVINLTEQLVRKECEEKWNERRKRIDFNINDLIDKARADEQNKFEKERQAIEHLLRTDSTIARVCEEVGIIPTEHPFLYNVTEKVERLKEDKGNNMIEKLRIDELIGYLIAIGQKYPEQKESNERYINLLENLKKEVKKE